MIGLDKNGYGRILGQCQLGSKLFYTLWETVAKENDPFICVNFIKPDVDELRRADFKFDNENDVREYMLEYILGIKNEILHLVRICDS